jgi:FKBP-type peptidyl-prolyl cis-trans isomerase
VRSPRLRLMAAAAAPLMFLAACGSSTDPGDDDAATTSAPGDDAAATSAGPSADLAEVDVDTDGDQPTLTWDGQPFAEGELPFITNETQVEEVQAGDGDEVAATDEVEVRYLLVNGASGQDVATTFAADQTVTLDLNDELLFPAFLDNLPGRTVGDRVLMAIPADQGFGPQGNQQLGVGPEDSLLFYLEIDDAQEPLDQAQGEEAEVSADLPQVQADGQGPAQIDVEGVQSPDQIVAEPLIVGDRKEVQPGQNLRVHYTGVKLSDGEQFDSSYDRDAPFDFLLGAGQVIPGWDEGLAGQTVGSRILLVIPAADAYGEDPEGHELGGEDLVFVVDILGAY